MQGRGLAEYYVFVASPGDVATEREQVRAYFDNLNRTTAVAWRARFQVIDWENFSTTGVGRPQELITQQTLARYRESLALVIVLMAQRFGTPSGDMESGTEEEARWALSSHAESGFPEVKFFFREVTQFVGPADPTKLREAFDQWDRVLKFRNEIQAAQSAYVKTYPADEFEPVLRKDLDLWFTSEDRPWATNTPAAPVEVVPNRPPLDYHQNLVHKYRWLDIAGIDSDRAFKLPLDEIYVRLRVVSATDDTDDYVEDTSTFDIQTALERYSKLVIVGDPGSGKSTFLKFIALTLGECMIADKAALAAQRLSMDPPLPTPIFLSCWDLSEYLQRFSRASLDAMIDFIVDRVGETGWPIDRADFVALLKDHPFIILVDGLDEVPTDEGRHIVRQLIEELVGRYPNSRYVVTSRIRAYTGDTVLGQNFARCDIQPFSKEERTAFLKNWVNQLFKVRKSSDATSVDATAELDALTEAIETSSIRLLAVNPLLLTVIAIVHWNRKRLPEQRVDLYDECVDVLLGQRKQAEQRLISRDTRLFDESYSEDRLDQRTWVRKRFAELAYAIISRSDEELDRAAAIEILAPHFAQDERADPKALAERFLERQELRSGLLVRRGIASYRFVHLTFLEYLAAWHLASRDLSKTLEIIALHFREPKWFETLQLLGGELANRSDEHLDKFVSWLLDSAGDTVREQAPVIALAANIVRDTHAVASIGPKTREQYDNLLCATFDAFTPNSKVPKQVQLDLLVALGNLGASVKDQLISATGSRLLDVRRRALAMLIPHLSDDDLFSMKHVLADRSKEPVKTYIDAIVARDRTRAGALVLDVSLYGEKTTDGLREAASPKLPATGIGTWPVALARVFSDAMYRFGHLGKQAGMLEISSRLANHRTLVLEWLDRWDDRRHETFALVRKLAECGVDDSVAMLVKWRDSEETWQLVRQLAEGGSREAIAILVRRDGDDAWELVRRLAEQGVSAAIRTLVQVRSHYNDTWALILRLAEDGSDDAIDFLARSGDRVGWDLIRRLAAQGMPKAIEVLAWAIDDGDGAWEMIQRLAEKGVQKAREALGDREFRRALRRLGESDWGSTMGLNFALENGRFDIWQWRSVGDDGLNWFWISISNRLHASGADADASFDNPDFQLVIRWFAQHGSAKAVEVLLPYGFRRAVVWKLVRRLAAQGIPKAIGVLVSYRGDHEDTWELIRGLAEQGTPAAIGAVAYRHAAGAWELTYRLAEQGVPVAVELLVRNWGHRKDTWDLIQRMDRSQVSELGEYLAWLDWTVATMGETPTVDW